jgi:hypothetical protein
MSKLYRSREGEATAVDTKTQLTTLGSETAPGPLLVPAGAKTLLGVIVASSDNMAAATSCSGLIRLEGPGLPGGPEVIATLAAGHAVTTGGNNNNIAVFIPLNIPVTPANEILIFGEMCGTDTGQLSFGVTLVFQL